MIPNRLNSLLQLHGAIIAVLVGGGIFACALIARILPVEPLAPDVNLVPYALATGLALIFSIRRFSSEGSPYYSYTWIDWARITTRQIGLVALVVFGLTVILRDSALSRPFIVLFLVSAWLLLLVVNALLPRLLMRLMFPRDHRLSTIFICSDDSREQLQNWLRSREALGVQPVGFLSDAPAHPELEREHLPFLGPLSALRAMIEAHNVFQVVILEMPKERGQARSIVDECRDTGCRVLVYNDLSDILGRSIVPVTQNGHQYCVLEHEPLEDPINRIVKRCFDIAVSAPLVVFVLPVLTLAVWFMQRRQAPGPIFFTQLRGGRKLTRFRMFKFRSMYVATRSSVSEAVQARRNDSRIYPFGAFLRRSSLDEFPQFLNVLRGEMSIVGPRPHLPEHDQMFARMTKHYRGRFNVKPGITGLAQCRGFRGEITHPSLIEQRITHDLRYIAQWSFWLDLQIFIRTAVQVVVPMKSAH